MLLNIIVVLLSASGVAASGDYPPFVANSQTVFEKDFDLTQHYWRVPAYLRFAKLRATPARLREIAGRNGQILATRDSGLSKFFAVWKPEEPRQIFVPVFADRAVFQDESVWVVVFNWEYVTATRKDGKMSAGHILVVALRQSTGEIVIYQPSG